VTPPVAHETWFVLDDVASDWGFVGETLTLALLALAVALTLLVRLIARLWPGVDVPFLGRLVPFMPFALRIHLAVSLVGLLSLGVYLSPAMDLAFDFVGVLLGAVLIVTAVCMAAGWHVRAAAWLLVAAGPIGMLEFGVLAVVQRIDLLGCAVFLLFTGAGRWSADWELGRAREPSLHAIGNAVWSLRLMAGTALIVVAFVEKLAQPDLALKFLAEYPQFNVARGIGLDWTHLEFIRVAGAIEVLFGLLLISGALPQVIVLIAGVPFNATLFFFGDVELLGHLPIYGTMLVLLVYGSARETRPLTSVLWPWGGTSARRRVQPATA
jgi:hypothetical protein